MIALTENQRDLLRAAIDLALNTWDNAPENAELHPVDDHLIEGSAANLVTVMFNWASNHGSCYDCGLPAAFALPDAYGPGKEISDHHKRCAVCAANAAAVDGERVVRLEPLE